MRINFAAAHKRLWLWLANNPHHSKRSWPEWRHNGGRIPYVRSHCFACEAAFRTGTCPLKKSCKMDTTIWRCLKEWKQLSASTLDEIPALARKIANKPWKGRQFFDI